MSRPKGSATPTGDGSVRGANGEGKAGKQHPPVRVIPLSDLKPAPYNPRTISQDAINGLAASLERFGVVEPIVWNERTKHIVGGHQRFEVLKQRGDTEAQVIVVDLDEREEKALNVTLNNPNIAGSFTDQLQELLTAFKLDDALWDELSKLRLDTLLVDFSPLELGDGQGALDKKTLVTCPSCGHEFES
jgi:hypothetical protein